MLDGPEVIVQHVVDPMYEIFVQASNTFQAEQLDSACSMHPRSCVNPSKQLLHRCCL